MAIRAEIPLRNAARLVEAGRQKSRFLEKKWSFFRKKWSWLEKSGRFLEKIGLDVIVKY